MDQRQARRLIARWAAAACRSLSTEEFVYYSADDMSRLLKAQSELAAELDARGGIPRPPKNPAPPDPNQTTLWEDL
jgi:hypothetical protein